MQNKIGVHPRFFIKKCNSNDGIANFVNLLSKENTSAFLKAIWEFFGSVSFEQNRFAPKFLKIWEQFGNKVFGKS